MAQAMGVEPCPICGSANVRWRGRRPTDFLLTWLRYAGEMIAQALTRGSTPRRSGAAWHPDLARYDSAQLGSELHREHIEAGTGLKTPKRFWKCRDCGREGHEFA